MTIEVLEMNIDALLRAAGRENQVAIIQPSHLESAGFKIPALGPSAIFATLQKTKEAAAKAKTGEITANFTIGAPPITDHLLTQLEEALLPNRSKSETAGTQPENIAIEDQVDLWTRNTIIKAMIDYSPPGGDNRTREIASQRMAEMQGADLFTFQELTLVTGGSEKAIEHINTVLSKAMPFGNATLHLIDTRDRQKSWTEILDEIETADENTYIHLVVQDSAFLEENTRDQLIKKLKDHPQLVVTDLISQETGQNQSLSKNPEIRGLVVAVDNSPVARATNSVAVFGDKTLIKAVQARQTRELGTPSTPQMNLAVLLSDEKVRAQLADLPDEVIEQLISENQIYLASSLDYLRALAQQDLPQAQAIVASELNKLEERLHSFHEDLLPGEQGVVIDGGGRGGIVSVLEYYKTQGIKKVLVASPCWTYDDTAAGLEIVYVDAYDENGQFNTQIMTDKMKELTTDGTKIALITQSGIHNPTGTVISKEAKQKLLEEAAATNTVVIDDAAYVHEVYEENKEKGAETYAQIAEKSGIKVPSLVTLLSFSKDLFMPGARLCYVSSKDSDLQAFIKNNRKIPNMNGLAVLMGAKLAEPTDNFKALHTMITDAVNNMKLRVQAVYSVCEKYAVIHGKAEGAFYVPVRIPYYEREDPIKGSIALASQRAGALPMAALQGHNVWKSWARLALGGNKSPAQIEEEVEYFVKTATFAEKLSTALEDWRKQFPAGEPVMV